MAEIYLDHNATTPLAPEVLEAMLPILRGVHGNPSCGHRMGREARALIDDARRELSEFFGCARAEVVFTGGGTEANNMAIKGAAIARMDRGKHLVVGGAEHQSVVEAARSLERFGFEVTEVPVDGTGQVTPEALQAALRPDTTLVSVMHAQNVVGTVNRIEELAEVLTGRGILFHCDAAQSAGKIPCAFPLLGVDLLTIAGHKLYGPKGVGALLVRRGVELEPLLHGAGHEAGRRSGTENTAAIVGLAAAIRMARGEMAAAGERVVALRDALHLLLAEALPGVVLNGHPFDRLPNTLNLSFLGVNGADIAARVPELLLATGPACHDRDTTTVSPTFRALGLGPERSRSSLRITLGRHTTFAEVEQAAAQLADVVRALRGAAGALPPEASAPSQPPGCPRCEGASSLTIARDGIAPRVVCARHPECRAELYLAAPAGAH